MARKKIAENSSEVKADEVKYSDATSLDQPISSQTLNSTTASAEISTNSAAKLPASTKAITNAAEVSINSDIDSDAKSVRPSPAKQSSKSKKQPMKQPQVSAGSEVNPPFRQRRRSSTASESKEKNQRRASVGAEVRSQRGSVSISGVRVTQMKATHSRPSSRSSSRRSSAAVVEVKDAAKEEFKDDSASGSAALEFPEAVSLEKKNFFGVMPGYKNPLAKSREIEDVLIDAFPVLLSSERSKVAASLEEKVYSAGHVLYNQGDEGNCFYIVRRGKVVVAGVDPTTGLEQFRQTFVPLTPDDTPASLNAASNKSLSYFGERALIEKEPRAGTATCIIETSLVFLTLDTFNRLLGPMQEVFKERLRKQNEAIKIRPRFIRLARAEYRQKQLMNNLPSLKGNSLFLFAPHSSIRLWCQKLLYNNIFIQVNIYVVVVSCLLLIVDDLIPDQAGFFLHAIFMLIFFGRVYYQGHYLRPDLGE